MITKGGDRYKSCITNKVYEVKTIERGMVILVAKDGSSQLLTERENLKLFYKKEDGEGK